MLQKVAQAIQSIDLDTIVIVATLLGGMSALWFVLERLVRAVKTQKVYFPENNETFYEYYAKCISQAKDEIWITSDGFNMRNSISRECADIMLSATRQALQKGVRIIRLQILETMHLNWIPHLKALKSEFPENFHVWINPPLPSIPNVCAIDPDRSNSVAERMQHRLGSFGQGSMAHTYSFTHGDQKRTKLTKSIVQEAIDHPGARELDVDDFEGLYRDLLDKRLATLRAWVDTQDSLPGLDLSVSGIFDEIVITEFMRQQPRTTDGQG